MGLGLRVQTQERPAQVAWAPLLPAAASRCCQLPVVQGPAAGRPQDPGGGSVVGDGKFKQAEVREGTFTRHVYLSSICLEFAVIGQYYFVAGRPVACRTRPHLWARCMIRSSARGGLLFVRGVR